MNDLTPAIITPAAVLVAVLCLFFVVSESAQWWRCWQIASDSAMPEDDLETDQRAEALLREVLSAQQCTELWTRGFLEVPSPSCPARVYRVRPSRRPVEVYEDRRLVDRLCVQPVDALPPADLVVLHKLLIEGAEAEYLELANHVP